MSEATAGLVGMRIAEHSRSHALERISIVLHGGEPLLVGVPRLERLLAAMSAPLVGVVEADLRIHTNGVTLDRQFCDLFARYGVRVGVSLDGDQASNDRHRRYADGRSSHADVQRALKLLRQPEYRDLYAGILCTVDLANDPDAVYESLVAESPEYVDLLLPHATWDVPPRRPDAGADKRSSATAYADWLIRIYDRWRSEGRPIGIRIFESVESTAAGGPTLTETLGLAPSDVLVIETNGEIEQVDSLKTAYPGAPATGLDIARDTFDAAALHPGIRARQRGYEGLNTICRSCPVVRSCGGGYYPHRHRTGRGFDNPSVYCNDLLKLILHIERSTGHASGPAPESYHTVEPQLLAELAGGQGGTRAVGALTAAQESINKLLLERAATAALARQPRLRPAWNLLVQIDRGQHGGALAKTLGHPYFRAWAVRVLGGEEEPAVDGQLSGIALAAAARAGVEAELPVPVRDGAVAIASFGRFVGPGDGGQLVVRTSGGGFGTDSPTGCWEPAHTLAWDGHGTLRLEDTDPERDCYRLRPSDRLSERDQRAWQDCFSAAWRQITRDHAAYAPGLAAGLRAIAPLAPPGDGRANGESARHAFGAVGAALPSTPDRLALILLREFQRSKMGAVLDLYDLYDESDQRLFYVPWQFGPGSLEELLQGSYAHIAVTDYWRVRRTAARSETEARAAEVRFAQWRGATAESVGTLAESGSLTSHGQMFADEMQRTLAPWLSEPVSADAERPAATARHAHRAAHG
jgi:uncharacterized protein